MAKILENLNRRAEKGRAAVIVVDVQNDFLHTGGHFARLGHLRIDERVLAVFIENLQRLTDAARSQGLPVIYAKTELRQDYADSLLSPIWAERGMGPESGFLLEGSWGSNFLEGLSPKKQDFVVTKKGHGAFRDTYLDRLLTNLGVVHCLIAGFGGISGGVDDTSRQGRPLGYELMIVSDAVYPLNDPSFKELEHQAELLTTEEAIRFLESRKWPQKADRLDDQMALIVVDLQNDSIHPKGANALYGGSKLTPEESEMVVRNNQRLIRAMRERGYAVIHTLPEHRPDEFDNCASPIFFRKRSSTMPLGSKHRENSWGNEFVKGLEPGEGDFVLVKKAHSAFIFNYLHRLLRNLNVGTCFVTGGSIRGCAGDTIREGIALGFRMVPISDATYKPNSPYLKVLADRASIMNTEEVLNLLERQGGENDSLGEGR